MTGAEKSGAGNLVEQRLGAVWSNPLQLSRQNCSQRLRTVVEALPQNRK